MGRTGKVEISGVSTASLPVLTREEAKDLARKAAKKKPIDALHYGG